MTRDAELILIAQHSRGFDDLRDGLVGSVGRNDHDMQRPFEFEWLGGREGRSGQAIGQHVRGAADLAHLIRQRGVGHDGHIRRTQRMSRERA